MLKVTSPAAVPWAPPSQIPSSVNVALTFDAQTSRCILECRMLDAKGKRVQIDVDALPQQPPRPTAAQIEVFTKAEGVATDTIDQAISRRAIPLVQAIFGLVCTVE